MAKWVTFYYDLMSGIHDLVEHKNKEDATEYFKKHYRGHFQLNRSIKIELPMSYGYPHRKYIGMSKRKFENEFLKEGEQNDE